jgi:hypothetical protein
MPRYVIGGGYIRTLKNKQYTYYVARITILRRTYSKTFQYNEIGYAEAEEYLKTLAYSLASDRGQGPYTS